MKASLGQSGGFCSFAGRIGAGRGTRVGENSCLGVQAAPRYPEGKATSGRTRLTRPCPASPRGDPPARYRRPALGLAGALQPRPAPLRPTARSFCLPEAAGEELRRAPEAASLQGKARGSAGEVEAALGEGRKGQTPKNLPHPFLLRWDISPFLALFRVAPSLEGEGEGERGAVAFP